MDVDATVAALQKAIDGGAKLVPPMERLRVPTDSVDYARRENEAFIPEELWEDLSAQLHAQQELAGFEQGMALLPSCFDNLIILRFPELARWLVAQSLKPAGPATAVEKLAEVLRSNSATVLTVMALAGIEPASIYELPEGVCLIPFSNLPPSWAKDNLERQFLGLPILPAATAALIRRTIVSPALMPLPIVPLDRRQRGTSNERYALLRDFQRCLTLIGPAAVVPAAIWTQIDDPRLPVVTSAPFAGLDQMVPLLGLGSEGRTSFDVAKARTIICAYRALASGQRETLAVPLDRLNQAIREKSLVDKAIDLAIAFESLLLNEMGKVQGELAYRIRLRGAFLANRDPAERRRRFDLLRDIYSMRSEAVHSGKVKNAERARHRLQEGIYLCAKLIEETIAGKRPSDGWDDLILGVS